MHAHLLGKEGAALKADAIIEKILEDARQSASKTLAEAGETVEKMRAKAEEESAARKQAAREKARQAAEEQRRTMMRMAELDQRKELLSMKRRLLDETFGGTLARMEAMNPDKAREFMTRKLLEAAQGDETLAVSPRQAEIFDEAFVDQVNRLLSEKGVPGQLARRVDQSLSDGGLLLQRGGMTVDLTYRSILNEIRPSLEAQAAELLFHLSRPGKR